MLRWREMYDVRDWTVIDESLRVALYRRWQVPLDTSSRWNPTPLAQRNAWLKVPVAARSGQAGFDRPVVTESSLAAPETRDDGVSGGDIRAITAVKWIQTTTTTRLTDRPYANRRESNWSSVRRAGDTGAMAVCSHRLCARADHRTAFYQNRHLFAAHSTPARSGFWHLIHYILQQKLLRCTDNHILSALSITLKRWWTAHSLPATISNQWFLL